jgi:hypothetical protein
MLRFQPYLCYTLRQCYKFYNIHDSAPYVFFYKFDQHEAQTKKQQPAQLAENQLVQSDQTQNEQRNFFRLACAPVVQLLSIRKFFPDSLGTTNNLKAKLVGSRSGLTQLISFIRLPSHSATVSHRVTLGDNNKNLPNGGQQFFIPKPGNKKDQKFDFASMIRDHKQQNVFGLKYCNKKRDVTSEQIYFLIRQTISAVPKLFRNSH